MKLLLLLLCCLLLVPCAFGQVDVQLEWDASATQGTPDNPVKYKVYICTDQALTNCDGHDAGTALTYGPVTLQHNSSTWFYATAYMCTLVVDGACQGEVPESDKSNILGVRAFSPPGNPSNSRIRIIQ